MTHKISKVVAYSLIHNTVQKLCYFIHNGLGIVCSAFKRLDVVSYLLRFGLGTHCSDRIYASFEKNRGVIECVLVFIKARE